MDAASAVALVGGIAVSAEGAAVACASISNFGNNLNNMNNAGQMERPDTDHVKSPEEIKNEEIGDIKDTSDSVERGAYTGGRSEEELDLESSRKTVNGYDTKVNVGQQNKHIPGTNEYKNALNNGQTKSIIYGDANDIQNLLNDKAGTGDFLGTNKERVNFGQIIGQYVDPNTGVGVETTIGIIHYGKKGAHIVPARPN